MAPFCTLKLILIGESGVGKTSLLKRFVDGIFRDMPCRQTIIDLKVQTIQIYGKLVKLEIWDTAGQERYRAISREYYRNSDGIVLMYDVTNLETYYKVNSWLSELRKYSDGVTIIVGNKNEDPTTKKVQATVVSSYAKEEGLDFIETSVKTGDNVEKVFQILVKKILEQRNPTLFKSSTIAEAPDLKITPSRTEVTADDDVISLALTYNTDDENVNADDVIRLSHTYNTDDTNVSDDDDDVIKLSPTPPVPKKRCCFS